MKIGDKVRFLSEVGGGVISGFTGKDIVLVRDEDGFDIPARRCEVVVVEANDYNIAKVNTMGMRNTMPNPQSPSQTLQEQELEPCDKPMSYRPKAEERKGGDTLNVYLSFVPVDVKSLSSTTFETYIVNDSNYYLQICYASADGAAWKMRYCGVVAPNCKEFVEEIDRSMLNDLSRVCIQILAWKEDKTYLLKPALSAEMRIDGVKFYKLHLFQPNEFFSDPNLTFDVVRDDKPLRQVFVDAGQLQDALMEKKTEDEKPHTPKPKPQKAGNERLEIDLHSAIILDNTTGMSNGDILMMQMAEFRRVMDENRKQIGREIVFIHGKGDGVLRKNIIQEIKYRYKGCTWQDASFREYGFGATMVKIRKEPAQ